METFKAIKHDLRKLISSGESDEGSSNKNNIGNLGAVAIVVLVILIGLIGYNAFRIADLSPTGISGFSISGSSKVLPTGIPAIYGSELSIRYDDVSASTPQKADAAIDAMGNLDRSITLTGADLTRYISILSRISCEYCCGAASVITSAGTPACGCAHSYAMRGLGKYLITQHGDEFTDDEILEEIGKWKVLFFPDIHESKAAVLESQGIELSYINLASNKYRGIEQGASGGSMVGGC